MRRFSGFVAAASVALALAPPARAEQAPSATPTTSSATSSATAGAVVAERARTTVSLSRTPRFSHVGQRGVRVTVKVREGRRKVRGTVVFSVDGKKLRTATLRRGTAAVRLPRRLDAGRHLVRARYGRVSDSMRVRVHDSALTTQAGSYTISDRASVFDLPQLSGTVRYKGAPATKGYVEVYEGGRVNSPYESPDYMDYASVSGDGSYIFREFFRDVQEKKGPGTYQYVAYYVPNEMKADRTSLHSAAFSVTVTE